MRYFCLMIKMLAERLACRHSGGSKVREADVTTAAVMSNWTNVERAAGFAMVGSDDLANTGLTPRADPAVAPREAASRVVVVRSPSALARAAEKSLWSWGSGWSTWRAPA